MALYRVAHNRPILPQIITVTKSQLFLKKPAISLRALNSRVFPMHSKRAPFLSISCSLKGGPEASKTMEGRILAGSAITVVLAVANRVLYKLALVPMRDYPFFLAQFTTFGYVGVYFSILYLRYCAGVVTKEMLEVPKLRFMAIGLLEALGVASGMSAGAMLPGPAIPILSQAFLVWQLIFSVVILGRKYSWHQIFGCLLVFIGVILAVVSGANEGQFLSEIEFLWPALMVVSSAFQAGASILKEFIFIDAVKGLQGKPLDIFVVNSFGSGFQALFVFLLLPFLSKLRGIPFLELPAYLKAGAACFLNIVGNTTAIGSMEAGPVDPSVLTSQDRHRSMTCAQDDSVLNCLDHFAAVRRFRGDDPRVMVQLARAGFLHYSRLSYIRLDRALITSLVERWRPETCTFHLRVGEMTIILQDVAVLLGLRIDGDVVTGGTGHDWQHLCMQHLGRAPQHMRGGSVKLTWLRESFPHLGPFATEIEIQQYTRAYILHQIGCTLFPDMSKNNVHLQWLPLLADLDACGTLSWGSAVLAYLYDEMTTVAYKGHSTIGGCLTLLQLWSWTRLSIGRPTFADLQLDGHQPLGCRYNVSRSWDTGPDRAIRFYRNELDLLDAQHVEWRPYTAEVLGTLPPFCTIGAHLWRARVPIICFDVVTMHVPDRVFRQLGLVQHIPDDMEIIPQFERRGRSSADWAVLHAAYIIRWDERALHIEEQRHPLTPIADYEQWYWGITCRFILTQCPPIATYVPHGPIERELFQGLHEIDNIIRTALRDDLSSGTGYHRTLDVIRRIYARYPPDTRYAAPLPQIAPPLPAAHAEASDATAVGSDASAEASDASVEASDASAEASDAPAEASDAPAEASDLPPPQLPFIQRTYSHRRGGSSGPSQASSSMDVGRGRRGRGRGRGRGVTAGTQPSQVELEEGRLRRSSRQRILRIG